MAEEEEIQVGYLQVSADQKGFMQHKMCFRQCVNNMTIPTLDAAEHQCVKNCLFRFNSAQRIALQKIRQTMQTYIMSDPSLKKSMKSN